MSERKIIPIPDSSFPTRIEVYYDGELNRTGGVQAGATEASIKLPAPVEECEIRIIPCDQQGKPVGRGHIYKDESIQPEPPEHTDPPAAECDQPECSDDECDGECDGEGACESSEVEADAAASVVIERAEADEPAEESSDESADEPADESDDANEDDEDDDPFEDDEDEDDEEEEIE